MRCHIEYWFSFMNHDDDVCRVMMEGQVNEAYNANDGEHTTSQKGQQTFEVDEEGVKEKPSKWGVMKNVVCISIAFMVLFTSYQSMASLQSSINQVSVYKHWVKRFLKPFDFDFRLMDWGHTPYQSFMPHWSFRHNLRQVWWSNMPVQNGPWLVACFVIPFTLVLNFIQRFIPFYQQRWFWGLLQHLYGSLNVITWQRWGIQLRPVSLKNRVGLRLPSCFCADFQNQDGGLSPTPFCI